MTETRMFMGIPIEGDVYSIKRTEQKSAAELAEVVKAVFDDPFIVDFGWRQYTPGFNDGDPCVFGAGDIWVRTTADDPGADIEDLDDSDFIPSKTHPALGNSTFARHPITGRYDYQPREVPNPDYDAARLERCVALNRGIAGGSFDHALLALFGDNVRIHVTRTGITVDEYDCGY